MKKIGVVEYMSREEQAINKLLRSQLNEKKQAGELGWIIYEGELQQKKIITN